MSDIQGKVDRFQILLQQLQLTDDSYISHFRNASIEKIVVEKRSKSGIFIFV